MIAFETSARINRPIDEVFSYLSEPLNFPRWNSAVQGVRKTSADEDSGSTYLMERELPAGRAVNQLEVVVSERPREFAIRTTAGPTPFLYRYHFSAEKGETIVQLDAEVELPGAAALVPPFARRLVKNGVDNNLTTLKQILEAPRRWSADHTDRSSLDGGANFVSESPHQVLWALGFAGLGVLRRPTSSLAGRGPPATGGTSPQTPWLPFICARHYWRL